MTSPLELQEPDSAVLAFGERLPLARMYAEFLATAGIERGLLGPREVPRLWERHLLNCVALAELLLPGTRLVDVGTGAGLPGLVVAIARPDLRVDLVESLQRRVDFLTEAVELLGLVDQARVVRGRAEDPAVIEAVGGARWVTARAVAPLDRLMRWCLPLLAPDGEVLAMKGVGAADELEAHRDTVRRLGGTEARVVSVGAAYTEPVQVVVIRRGARTDSREPGQRKGRR